MTIHIKLENSLNVPWIFWHIFDNVIEVKQVKGELKAPFYSGAQKNEKSSEKFTGFSCIIVNGC